jgi:hypothetical protein
LDNGIIGNGRYDKFSCFMIPLEEFKKSLGSLADSLSEEEILALREKLDRLAEIIFDLWLRKRNSPDKPANGK